MNEIAFPCGHTVAHEEECPRCGVDSLRQQLAQACKERNELKHALADARAALEKYGRHSDQCNRLAVLKGDCYCGFHAASDDALAPILEASRKRINGSDKT